MTKPTQHSVDFLEGIAEGKAATIERCAQVADDLEAKFVAFCIRKLKDDAAQVGGPEAAKTLKLLCEEITDMEGREGMTDAQFVEQVIALAQAASAQVGEPTWYEIEKWQTVANQGIHIETQLRKELLTIKAATIERCAQVVEKWMSIGVWESEKIAAAIRKLKDEP